jgi:hypothetical protein
MKQPQRSQPSRSARLSGALPSTTLPEVLEHSTLRLSDVEHSEEGAAGEGILVRLFRGLPKVTRSVGDSKRTLWIVSSPDASRQFLSRWKDAQKSGARTSRATKAGSLEERTAKVKLTNGKVKARRPPVRGKRNPLMSGERGKGDNVEPDDPSDEEEEGAENDNDEEVEEGGNGEEEEEEEEEAEESEAEKGEAEESEAEESEAEESEAEESEAEEGEAEEEGEEEEHGEEEGVQENGTENHNAVKDVTTERKAVEDFENEDDAEVQDDDRNDGELDGAQAKEADKRKDRDDSGEEDKEKDAQDEEEREEEAGGEHEAEEAGDMVGKPSETKEKDGADEDEQAEENEDEDDEEAEEEMETHDGVREDREAMEQRVTANNRDGAQGDCRLADIADKEGEERDTGSGGGEGMAGEENRDPVERRKRRLETCEVSDCPTPGDRPSKRSRSNESESGDDATTDTLSRLISSPERTPRPRESSPTSTTASPGSILEIVRQTSAVPGLGDTEEAVWDAAQKDSVICSLSLGQQAKMIRTALSLSSEEGIKELRRFVANAREDGKRGSGSLVPEFNLSTPQPDFTGGHADNALMLRDRGIAHFPTLFRHLDILDGKTTLFSIAKRAKLAAMAQYRNSILPEGASRKDTRSATLRLFHAVWPYHDTIERPEDKATNPAAYADWIRLRDRLKEGRQWLAVRDLFGGDGAFLALPPQCVSDRDVLKMPSEVFEAWLGLLEVAWKALDDRARQTLNALVRLALAAQPFPGDVLALELLGSSTGATPTSLSAMFTGWSAAARNVCDNEDGARATLTERKEYGDATDPETSSTTTSMTRRIEEAGDAELILQKDTMGDVSDELFDGVNFDDPLSQEI